MRRPVALLFIGLLFASCSNTEPPERSSQPEPSASVSPLRALGTGCGFTKRAGDITFVKDGRLYATTLRGHSARCIAEVGSATDIEWGPRADRFHLGDLQRVGADQTASLDDPIESIAWSRPTGKSIVYITDGRLMKVGAFSDKPMDISFLADHDELVYHPAGTHIAVAGTDEDGTYGLWLATNLGEEKQLIAIAEDAKRVYSLAFGDRGFLYYAAEHEDRYDVHRLTLAAEDEEGTKRDAELETLHTTVNEITRVAVSDFFVDNQALTINTCAEVEQHLFMAGSSTPIASARSIELVGWLSGDVLLYLAREGKSCEGPANLYAYQVTGTRLIMEGVEAAGTGQLVLSSPAPPGSEQEVIA